METGTLRPRGRPPVAVHAWRADDGGRRPVLLAVHERAEAGAVLGPLAAALGHRWTVVAPDLPGHGASPATRPEDDDGAVAAVVAVLAALPRLLGHRRPVVLLGHGAGALVAARAAAARPDRLAHLVLEDPARATPRRLPRVDLAEHRTLAALDAAERAGWSRSAHPAWAGDEHGPWAAAVGAVDLAALARPAVLGPPLVEVLAEVRAPVTLLHGDPRRGGHVSPTAARTCVRACRAGGEAVAVATGHHVRREARAPFAAVLGDVLGRAG